MLVLNCNFEERQKKKLEKPFYLHPGLPPIQQGVNAERIFLMRKNGIKKFMKPNKFGPSLSKNKMKLLWLLFIHIIFK